MDIVKLEMKKLGFIFVVIFTLFFLVNPINVSAGLIDDKDIAEGNACDTRNPNQRDGCKDKLICEVSKPPKDPNEPTVGTCIVPSSTIQIQKPEQGFASLGNAISNFFTIALVVAIILVLIMLIIGAYEWITSGGDKEAVAKARNRIINALIGLVVLAVAFALAKLAGQITGFPDIFNLVLPTPDPNAPGV